MTPEDRYAKFDERLKNVALHMEIIASMVHSHDEQLDKAAKILEKVSDTMDRISRLMENHEHRIEDLENGKQ